MQKLLFFLLPFIFLFSLTAQADIFMKQKHHTDGMTIMGQTQPAKDTIQKIWITEDKISNESEEQTVLMFFDKKMMYIINHAQKTYMEMPLDFNAAMSQSGKEDGEKKPNFMNMAQGMKFEVTVTPTNETKKINKWNCRKYNQKLSIGMGPVVSEIWASEELKMDYNVYAKFSSAMMTTMPGFSGSMEKAIDEFKKIKGVPVLTTTTMNMMGMEMKSSQELLEFKDETAPKSVFDIPKGYKKTEMMGMPE